MRDQEFGDKQEESSEKSADSKASIALHYDYTNENNEDNSNAENEDGSSSHQSLNDDFSLDQNMGDDAMPSLCSSKNVA